VVVIARGFFIFTYKLNAMSNTKFLKSILEQVIQKVYQSKTADEARNHMLELLNDSGIKETDRNRMIQELNRLQSLKQIQFYATNAMFKFEGLGVGNRTID
jgi:hypothetical protein